MYTSARKIAAIALLWGGVSAGTVHAQVLVEDAANLVVNTTTSISQVMNTIEAVLQTAYMALEIAGIDGLATDSEFESDLDSLVALIEDGAAVAWDLQSITRQVTTLFDLNTAPNTTRALAQRQQEMRRTIMEAHSTATRVQTLIRTASHTVTHIKRLLDRISGFTGNMQANQSINESLASLKRLEATQTATNTAFQRAMTLQAMERPLIEESIERIKDHWCGRWCEGR